MATGYLLRRAGNDGQVPLRQEVMREHGGACGLAGCYKAPKAVEWFVGWVRRRVCGFGSSR